MTRLQLLDRLRGLWSLLRDTYNSWREDRTIRLGAGLAYYGLFSLTSVIAMSIALIRLLGRSKLVEEAFADRLDEFVGEYDEAADIIASIFDEFAGPSGTSIGLIGLGTLLVTGSLFFLALEDAVHQIFGVPVGAGLKYTVRRRAVSLLVLLGACLTIVLALAVQAASGLLELLVPDGTPASGVVSAVVASVLGWAVLVGALILLLRYLPSVEVRWRTALVAAATTGIFLVIGTSLIGWYLRTVGASSVGGAASTPIAVLLWIYYEAQILLAGVQLTHVMTERERVDDAGGTASPEDAVDTETEAHGGTSDRS